MNKVTLLLGVLAAITMIPASTPRADVPQLGDTALKIPNKITAKAYAFDLKDVQLLDGPFKHAEDLDLKYLLSLDPDRLLHNFRLTAGLPSTAQPLGDWEKPDCELRGHFVGHYLTACALMVRSTGNKQLLENANKVVAGMAECQAKIGTGYVSGYKEEEIDRVIAAKQVWAPWYTLHKIYAGLMDMYTLAGNRQALDVAKKFGDWCYGRLSDLSDAQIQAMLAQEHGGMNESMANLYAITGDPKYLELATRAFYHKRILDPLSRRIDPLDRVHANTQFPKIIGAARLYELTGDDKCHTIADFFWNVVTQERSYVTGGNSDGEMFSPKAELSRHIGPASTECCNEYNMLKLTRHLFCWNPSAQYADFYERGLYNQILGSQHPETGMMLYYLPLQTGSGKTGPGVRGFNTPFDSFWCCTGSGVENHAKYGDSIYFSDGGQGLYVNLFIASELNWKAQGVKIRQETQFPEEASSKLVFTCEKPVQLTLNIRVPYWADNRFTVKINGMTVEGGKTPGGYLAATNVWRSGDVVEISMPMTLRTEGFKDNPDKLAVMYGPLVLSAWTQQGKRLAVIRADKDKIAENIKPVAGAPLTFKGPAAVFRTSFASAGGEVTFTPFYKEFTHPYVIYWDRMDDAKWGELEKMAK